MDKNKKDNITLEDKEVLEGLGTTLNKSKKDKYDTGETIDTREIKVQNQSEFSGMKTKKGRSLFKNGINYKIKPGTEWEKIPPMLKRELKWEIGDFKN